MREDARPTSESEDVKPRGDGASDGGRYIERAGALGTLTRAFDRACTENKLGFALLIGEPGMGKSRTIRELGSHIAAKHGSARVLAGEDDGETVAYGAFARLLGVRFGVRPGEPTESVHERIRAVASELLPGPRVTEVTHLVAHLMRVPIADSPVVTPLAESPQQLEARTFLALRRLLAADAERAPLVLVLENLELCGTETINLLHYLAAGLGGSPVLIAATAREQLYDRYPHFGEGDVPLEQVYLGALTPEESETLLREQCRAVGDLPEDLVTRARQLGGSPRAIFELVRLLHESHIIRDEEGEAQAIDEGLLAEAEIPTTYDGLVQRRLEVMPAEQRETLEKAAVIGDPFWLDFVAAIGRIESAPKDDPDGPTLNEIATSKDQGRARIADILTDLGRREWIEEVSEPRLVGEREFRFAYAHLRDAVYAGTDEAKRRRYHKLAAQWLELRPEGSSEGLQEDVGHHLERAGDVEAATARYQRAADAARAGFFNDKAIRLYAHALSSLGTADRAARIMLWHDLGSVYELRGDFDAALGAFERMLRLAWVTASRAKAAVAYNKMGRVWRRKGDANLALKYLERGRAMFEQCGDTRGIAGSLDDLGSVLRVLGRYDEAYANVTKGLELRGRRGDQRSIAQSLSNLGKIEKVRGRFGEALRCHREALGIRRSVGDRAGVIASLNSLAILAFERDDHEQARRGWESALAEAEEIGALPLQAMALTNLGELALLESRYDEAQRRLEDGLDIAEEIDDRRSIVEATRNLALLEHAAGDSATARELAHDAHRYAEGAGLRDAEGRALITLGEVFAGAAFEADQTIAQPAEGESAPAEIYFSRGIDALRRLEDSAELARALELYGRYKLDSAQVTAARELLKESAERFRTLGLPQAERVQTLLAEITPDEAAQPPS